MNRVSMNCLFKQNLAVAAVLALATQATAAVVTQVISSPQLAGVYDVTSDGANLYASVEGGTIFSLSLGGSGLTQLYQVGGRAQSITTIGNDLFWADPEAGPVTDTRIFRAPKSGGGPITAIYTGSAVGEPIVDAFGIATDGVSLFTADGVDGKVHRLSTNGTGITQLGSNRYGGGFSNNHGNSIDVLALTVYVADSGKPGVIDPQVVSIPTAGGVFTTLHVGAPFVSPAGIAVGDGSVFVWDPGANSSIWQLPIGGGTPTLVVSDARLGTLGGLHYLNGSLYLADYDEGAIWRIQLNEVPEPASATLFAFGAMGTLGIVWRKRRSANSRAQTCSR
jgi:hypothetical protein